MTRNRLALFIAVCFLPQLGHASDLTSANAGRALYKSVCSACHAPENVMVSAPKLGDASEWSRRLARSERGLDTLADNAVNGFGAMPPKGGHSELSRNQIRQAIEFMMNPGH